MVALSQGSFRFWFSELQSLYSCFQPKYLARIWVHSTHPQHISPCVEPKSPVQTSSFFTVTSSLWPFSNNRPDFKHLSIKKKFCNTESQMSQFHLLQKSISLSENVLIMYPTTEENTMILIHLVKSVTLKSSSEEEPRWWRNRTGRPLSPLQIHRKNNWTLSKLHKTTSDC